METYADPLPLALPLRLGSLAALLAIEWVGLASVVHTHTFGLPTAQFLCVGISLAIVIAYIRARPLMQRISRELNQYPLQWSLIIWHLGAVAALLGVSAIPSGTDVSQLIIYLRLALIVVAAVLSILLATCAFVPPSALLELVRGIGSGWIWAIAGAFLARPIAYAASTVWVGSFGAPVIKVTFWLTKALLSLFASEVIADPANASIGARGFRVLISGGCSGLEGMGLMFIFCLTWLWISRGELRFPRALMLIPLGVAAMFLLNVLRIAALVLIGAAGAKNIAIGGFHSQAGWIAFNGAALGLALIFGRIPWFAKESRATVSPVSGRNATAEYLLPFLFTLAAGMVSRAASSGFEWLYPLRVVACFGVLWTYRKSYSKLDWKFGPAAIATGAVVFIMWLALDRLAGTPMDNGIAAGLSALPIAAQISWVLFRIIGATLTVPIAEELAFRGFLIRRLMAIDFESLNARAFSYVAILGSSIAFGVMHGNRWLAGTVAGLLYAGIYLRRGRIGDPVIAHATTNALLSGYVLMAGKWYIW